MAYNLARIRNRVLNDKLDDTTFDPSVVDNFINDTQRDIFASYELPFMEKTFNGLLAEGSYILLFPDDHQLTSNLVIIDPTGYERNLTNNYLPFRTFNTKYPTPGNNTPGTPLEWTLFGGKLYLDKPTDQVYTLNLFYIKTPTTLSDDLDVPELPEMFEEALVLGAFYRCQDRNEDYDLAAVTKQEYGSVLATLGVRLSKRQTGTPNTMQQPGRLASARKHGRA